MMSFASSEEELWPLFGGIALSSSEIIAEFFNQLNTVGDHLLAKTEIS